MLTIIEIKAREDGGHGLQSQSHRTECWPVSYTHLDVYKRQAADRLAALTGVLGQTQGAYELLAEAQEQQNETGYLELDTVVKLLEEYPQLSGYLVEASNGYLLADGALQDYISTQRAEYALALNEAQSAADAIVTAEADKINAINATTLATKDQLTALAELYQSMGANADNLAEGVSYYAKALSLIHI